MIFIALKRAINRCFYPLNLKRRREKMEVKNVRKVMKFADGLGGVSIPSKVLAQYNLKPGDFVTLVPTEEGIVIKPLRVELVNRVEGQEKPSGVEGNEGRTV